MATRRRLSPEGRLPLPRTRYGVGISWDKGSRTVDLDLQAVIINTRGTIIDAVYYNKLEALDRALTHSGDEKSGDAEGLDETIWVNFPKLRQDVGLLVFIIAASSGASLRDASDATVHIVEKWQGNTLETFPLQRSVGSVVAVALVERSTSADAKWVLTRLNETAEQGSHFMDILEPTIGAIIRQRIKGAPKFQRVAFPMRKGVAVDMPQSAIMKQVAVGVGWDIGGGGIDLDVSAVFFDKDGQNVGAVFYNNHRQCGVVHTGDNQTGEGDGDDEVITVDLTKVPHHILQIFFVVNIYTKGATFESLKNAYCRVCDSFENEMLRYDLNDTCKGKADGSGLIISRFCRSDGSARWGFQAMGIFCKGRKWMAASCINEMQEISRKSPRQLEIELAKEAKCPKRQTKDDKAEDAAKTLEADTFESAGSAKRRAFGKMSSVSGLRLQRSTTRNIGGLQKVYVGVGWDILASKALARHVDLDVSAVFFHRDGRDVGAVDYENREEGGVLHSGDNTTGEGDGDDEVITVDLALIPEEVSQIFFVVTVYTKGMTFAMVDNAYCRVVDEDGREMVRYDFNETHSHTSATGLIIAQFLFHPVQGWLFKSRGVFTGGRTWLDPMCISEMTTLFARSAEEANNTHQSPQPPQTQRPVLWRKQTWSQALGVEPPEKAGQVTLISL